MKIHEYQAKAILAEHGVPVPEGYACDTPAEAHAAAMKLGGGFCVVKAQIHAGGRGKGGASASAGTARASDGTVFPVRRARAETAWAREARSCSTCAAMRSASCSA